MTIFCQIKARYFLPACRFLNLEIVKLAAKIACSLLFLYLIYRAIDVEIFLRQVVKPDYSSLFFMVFFSLLFVLLNGYKFYILLLAFGKIRFLKFTGYYIVSGSISSVIPSIFGDFALVSLLKKQYLVSEVVSVLIIDRFISLLLAIVFFVPVTVAILYQVSLWLALLTGTAAIVLSSLLIVVLFRRNIMPLQKVSVICSFYGHCRLFFNRHTRLFLQSFLVNCLKCIVAGIVVYFALRAAGLIPGLVHSICVANSLAFFTHIPISFGGIGFYEGSGLVLFEALGLHVDQVAVGLFYHRVYIILFAALVFLSVVVLTVWNWLVDRP